MRDLLTRWGIDLRPLRNPVFRTLFLGRLIAVFGLSMLSVTVSIQVYVLTGSSLQVAFVNSVLGVCSVAGSVLGGSLADRVDRRTVILTARGLAVLGFAALAVNSLLPEPSMPVIYIVTAADAAVASAGATAFGAAVPAVVPKRELPATGAVMALSLDIGSAIAPAIAGLMLTHASATVVYGAVVVLGFVSWLVLFRLPALPPPAGDQEEPSSTGSRSLHERVVAWPRLLWQQMSQAWAFSRADRVVGTVLLIGFVQILFASPFALIPEFVTTRLGGDEAAIGLLFSAPAVGALAAGAVSGWVGRVRRLPLAAVVVFTGSALGIAALGLQTQVWAACVLLGLIGAGDVIGEILRFTILSARTPDALRGRITGLWQAQTTVGDALGGPLLSLAARVIGAGPAIVIGGTVAAVLTMLTLLRPPVRQTTFDPSQEETA